MSNGSAIKAGRAFVELFLDESKLQSGLKKVQNEFNGIADELKDSGLKIAGVGVAIVGGMAAAVLTFAEVGSALNDMSARTGMSVEMLSMLDHAAGMVGASLEDVEAGAKGMSKLIAAADRGDKGATETLDSLALSIDQLATMSQDQRFMVFAERLSKVEDPAMRAAIAMQVFGKAGTKLLPLLSDNAQALKDLMSEAQDFGLVMSGEAAEKADAFGDSVDLLKKLLRQTVLEIGSAVLPIFMDWVKMAQQVVKSINGWIKANPELVQTVLKVGVALALVGGAIIALGVAAQAMSFIFAGVGMAISAAFAIASAPVAVISGLITALSSPLGALLVGVAAVTAAFLYMSGLGGAALQWLRDRFDELATTFSDTWTGIRDAVMAGDLQLAMSIAWTGIRLAWSQGVLWVVKIWNGLKLQVLSIWNDTVAQLQNLGSMAVAGLMIMWLEFSSFFEKLWNDVSAGFMNKWDEAIGWVEKRIHEVMGLFDSSYDVAGAQKMVDQRVGQETAQRDKQTAAANQAIQQEADKRKQEAGQVAGANAQAYQSEAEAANHALEAQYGAQEQEMRKQIEDLKNQLKGLNQEAAAKVKNKTPNKFDFSSGLDEEKKKQEAVKTSITSMGTFSSEGLFGFGSFGTAQERTAKATEETAKNTEKMMKDNEDDDGETFA